MKRRKAVDKMIFTFDNYVVDIGVEKTKQIYKELPLITTAKNNLNTAKENEK